jgi:hypothetical protein
MTETDLHNQLKKKVPGAYDRIENSATFGIPDCFCTVSGNSWMIEHKINKSGKIYMKPLQRNWHVKHKSSLIILFLIGADTGPPILARSQHVISLTHFLGELFHVHVDMLATNALSGWDNIDMFLRQGS